MEKMTTGELLAKAVEEKTILEVLLILKSSADLSEAIEKIEALRS